MHPPPTAVKSDIIFPPSYCKERIMMDVRVVGGKKQQEDGDKLRLVGRKVPAVSRRRQIPPADVASQW